LRNKAPLADGAIEGPNAGYANTGFIGFLLVLVAFGQDALGPTLDTTILTVCVLLAVAIVLIESSLDKGSHWMRLVPEVGRSLLRNPLLAAPALGTMVPIAGLALPHPFEIFLDLLGGAASPCALVALGLFLAERRETTERDTGTTVLLILLKLVGQPVVTWFMATSVFGLSPLLTHTAVLLAAHPTGTGPFMLAELYRRGAGVTSSVVFGSTLASVLTISGYLAWVV
jgi:malonate transporter